MPSYDGLDIEILTDTKSMGDGSSFLVARGVVINGQEIVALEGSGFTLGTKLGKAGTLEATFTVLVKSINFREREQ